MLNQYFGSGDGYEIMQGTSMASPHAAGAAALAAAVRPAMERSDVKSALLAGADRPAGLAGISVSGGRLNAAAAARIAAGSRRRPAPTPGRSAPSCRRSGGAGSRRRCGRAAAPEPRISGLRVSGQPRVCRGRRGCQARSATLTFVIAAEADVKVRLRAPGLRPDPLPLARSPDAHAARPAGPTRWTVGRTLAGMALRRGRWRVTLVTSAGRERESSAFDSGQIRGSYRSPPKGGGDRQEGRRACASACNA